MAAGIYIPSRTTSVSWKISPEHTVLGAELFAIKMALQFIEKYMNGRCIIFTDSLSALHLIQGKMKSYKQTVEDIKVLLAKLNIEKHVVLHWVKAHVGITGNEVADQTANLGHKNDRSCIYKLHVEEILCQLKGKFLESWDTYWKDSCHKSGKGLHLLGIRDSIKTPNPVASRSRAGSVALHRYRLGHVGVASHLFRFNMIESPLCMSCNVGESIEHVLIACKKYDTSRRKLKEKITRIVGPQTEITMRTILGGGNFEEEKNRSILSALQDFIYETKLIESI